MAGKKVMTEWEISTCLVKICLNMPRRIRLNEYEAMQLVAHEGMWALIGPGGLTMDGYGE
jgi:hypothetical protein